MSFYMVPTVLYQTQQKLKKAKYKKKKHKHHSDDNQSMKSVSTGSSHSNQSQPVHEFLIDTPLPPPPTVEVNVPTGSPSQPLTRMNLYDGQLSRNNSSTSLSSNIATKFNQMNASDPNSPIPSNLSTFNQTNPLQSHLLSLKHNHSNHSFTHSLSDQDSIAPDNNSILPPIKNPEDIQRHGSELSFQSNSSTSSVYPFRRNSSLVSSTSVPSNNSKISPSTPSRFSRRLSSPFLHDKKSHQQQPASLLKSPLSSPLEQVNAPPGLKKSPAAPSEGQNYFSSKIPQFKPLTDLEGLNTLDSLRQNFFTPSFQIFRYNNYLDILADHLRSDPINFASVRYHSISKFTRRHYLTSVEKANFESFLHRSDDIRSYEALLAYELLVTRSFIRELIRLDTESSPKQTTVSCEELVQDNFTNYIRFILNLPTLEALGVDQNELTEVEKTHYRIKHVFTLIQKGLHNLKKEDSGDELTNVSNSVKLLLQSITKVSYEFILLEKYHIHILCKLNNNFILESRVVKKLFNSYYINVALKNFESIKVLFYNNHFSAQYAWYMAVTIPFIRVFESNINSEDKKLINDSDAYQEHLSKQPKVSFKQLDAELFSNYFNYLNFKNNFDYYKGLSSKTLVEMHRLIDKLQTKSQATHESLSHKPMNFQYYTKSLSTIESETFHVIQSRDLIFQLSPSNYKVVLAEFYRILKKGGILELPVVRVGVDNLKELSQIANKKSFPDRAKFFDIDLLTKFDIIPKFLETLFSELNHLFGPNNIKYSLVLLNTSNEVYHYLIKHAGLSLYEIFDSIDAFCEKSQDELVEDVGLHYYFHIRAEKN